MSKENNIKKMMKELQSLEGLNDLLYCMFQRFELVLGIGLMHFKNPCFNEELVNEMSRKLREKGISSEIPMDDKAIMRATCCYHYYGCSDCRAVYCLKKLWNLPEGENALLDESLCEEVCRCVRGGAGILGLSLLFALLRTSPNFREDSLILFALTNSIKEDTWKAAAEIANIFFDAARRLKLEFLFFEPSVSAARREQRYADLDEIELERCRTVYANNIARIQEEKYIVALIEEVMSAALLEVKKSKMPRCCVCLDDPIDSPPIYGSETCKHKICCEECLHIMGLNEKLKYKCPLCREEFTDADVWCYLGAPNDDSDCD